MPAVCFFLLVASLAWLQDPEPDPAPPPEAVAAPEGEDGPAPAAYAPRGRRGVERIKNADGLEETHGGWAAALCRHDFQAHFVLLDSPRLALVLPKETWLPKAASDLVRSSKAVLDAVPSPDDAPPLLVLSIGRPVLRDEVLAVLGISEGPPLPGADPATVSVGRAGDFWIAVTLALDEDTRPAGGVARALGEALFRQRVGDALPEDAWLPAWVGAQVELAVSGRLSHLPGLVYAGGVAPMAGLVPTWIEELTAQVARREPEDLSEVYGRWLADAERDSILAWPRARWGIAAMALTVPGLFSSERDGLSADALAATVAGLKGNSRLLGRVRRGMQSFGRLDPTVKKPKRRPPKEARAPVRSRRR